MAEGLQQFKITKLKPNNIKMNYKIEVLKKCPGAVAKHWVYDNGAGHTSFWVVCSSEDFSYNSLSAISQHCKSKKAAWKSAYKNLNNIHKN